MHHIGDTADITCIVIHSQVKPVVSITHKNTVCQNDHQFCEWQVLSNHVFMVTVDEAIQKTVTGIFQFTHTCPHFTDCNNPI